MGSRPSGRLVPPGLIGAVGGAFRIVSMPEGMAWLACRWPTPARAVWPPCVSTWAAASAAATAPVSTDARTNARASGDRAKLVTTSRGLAPAGVMRVRRGELEPAVENVDSVRRRDDERLLWPGTSPPTRSTTRNPAVTAPREARLCRVPAVAPSTVPARRRAGRETCHPRWTDPARAK